MAGLAFPSCDSDSYMTLDLGCGFFIDRVQATSFSQRFTKKLEEPYRPMKLFGDALEKRASLCYTFRMKYAERSQGNAYYTFTSVTRWA